MRIYKLSQVNINWDELGKDGFQYPKPKRRYQSPSTPSMIREPTRNIPSQINEKEQKPDEKLQPSFFKSPLNKMDVSLSASYYGERWTVKVNVNGFLLCRTDKEGADNIKMLIEKMNETIAGTKTTDESQPF